MTVSEFKTALAAKIYENPKVLAIAQTGDINAPLIPGQSDIDIFVLCSETPAENERLALYEPFKGEYTELEMAVCSGGVWGEGDIMTSGGIEVMPMYFTPCGMENYIDSVLAGEHLWREGRFYPSGRLASVESINILLEKNGEWSRLKAKTSVRPQPFFEKSYKCHIDAAIDGEDMGRVRLRHELLFAHQVFEEALDHWLQALFALNGCYFPSRKRTLGYIEDFKLKPDNCAERLLEIIRTATDEETIEDAADELCALTSELRELGNKKFGG